MTVTIAAELSYNSIRAARSSDPPTDFPFNLKPGDIMPAKAKLIETLGPDHTALVLFDTLHGYLHPKDPKKQAFLKEHNIVPNLAKLLKGARRAGLRTFYPSGDHAA